MGTALQDVPPLAGHSPDRERPLGAYGALDVAFVGLLSGFGVWLQRTGRELPDEISARDLALVSIATFKEIGRASCRERV